MPSRHAGVIAACAALSLGIAAAGAIPAAASTRAEAGPAGGAAPVVASVTPDVSLDQAWRQYGDSGGQGSWAGADGTYSVPIPGGHDAWLFNDTFLGPVNADESLPSTAGFIHNSAVLTSPRATRIGTFITGGTRQDPQSLVGPTNLPPTPGGTAPYWYWNTDGVVDQGHLYVFEQENGPTDSPPPFNFGQTGMAIAKFSLPGMHLESVTPTYGGADVSWGVQLLREGPWIYIYGVESGSGLSGDEVHLARARTGHLLGPWQFSTGSGWSSNPAASAPLLGNVGPSYGVTKVDGQYVLATTGSFLNPQIYLYTAPTPAGPFTGGTKIYTPPEASQGLYAYNVAAHPELTGQGKLVLSYNVNSFSLSDLYANINNNRARFITVSFARP
ncbi:MAG: hypothetical protein JWM19_5438 [Actinomycetia bacterium]|nr:hypothetical protein [Actinomycetes bacterium]